MLNPIMSRPRLFHYISHDDMRLTSHILVRISTTKWPIPPAADQAGDNKGEGYLTWILRMTTPVQHVKLSLFRGLLPYGHGGFSVGEIGKRLSQAMSRFWREPGEDFWALTFTICRRRRCQHCPLASRTRRPFCLLDWSRSTWITASNGV